LNASKNIQRTWRGYKARTVLAESRRALFDDAGVADTGSNELGSLLVQKTRLLLAFFNQRRPDDIARIIGLSERIYSFGYDQFLGHLDVARLGPLAKATIAALQR
jgi:uncharacterized protein YfaA (DUF2138 family)